MMENREAESRELAAEQGSQDEAAEMERLRRNFEAVAPVAEKASESVANFAQNFDDMQEFVQKMNAAIRRLTDGLITVFTFFQSENYKQLNEILPGTNEYFQGSTQRMPQLVPLIERIEKALPKLQQEVDAFKADAKLETLTFTEAMQENSSGTILEMLLDRVEGQREEIDKLPWLNQIAKIPQTHILTNDPLTNALAGYLKKNGELEPIVNQPAFDLITINKPETTAYTMVTMPENVSFSQHMEPEDLSVFFSVISLLKAGNRIMTPSMIYREMRGMTSSEYVEASAAQNIVHRIEKMTVTKIYLDYTDTIAKINYDRLHSKSKNPKPPITDDNGEIMTEFVIGNANYNGEGLMVGPPIGDYMLEMSTHPVKNGRGVLELGYYVKFTPPLLLLCEKTDQIITVSSALMAIKETWNDNGTLKVMNKAVHTNLKQQTIKDYLLRRIAVMKHDKRNQKNQKQTLTIALETLYRKTDINPTDRKKTQAARSFAFKVLDYWTAMEYINGYSINYKGKKIQSISIKI